MPKIQSVLARALSKSYHVGKVCFTWFSYSNLYGVGIVSVTRFFATVTGANGFIFRKIIAWLELSWFGGVNNCFHDTRSSPSPGLESSREQDPLEPRNGNRSVLYKKFLFIFAQILAGQWISHSSKNPTSFHFFTIFCWKWIMAIDFALSIVFFTIARWSLAVSARGIHSSLWKSNSVYSPCWLLQPNTKAPWPCQVYSTVTKLVMLSVSLSPFFSFLFNLILFLFFNYKL